MSIFRKGTLERELCETVYSRAKTIIYNDNHSSSETSEYEYYDRFHLKTVVAWEERHENIATKCASINDVIRFADEYGCSVDYLLGRSNNPYPIGM